MFYFYTIFYSSFCAENALLYHYQMTQNNLYIFHQSNPKSNPDRTSKTVQDFL